MIFALPRSDVKPSPERFDRPCRDGRVFCSIPGTSYRATIKCPCRDRSSAHSVYPYADAHADCGTPANDRGRIQNPELESRIVLNSLP
jgi:hypothetical protein